VEREPPAHGRGFYCLLAAVAAACGGAPVDPERGASQGLVFVRRVGTSSEIARARLADGALRAVTVTPEREESWPYWSDRARRVVYEAAAPDPGAPADLVVWDPETQAETLLAKTPGRDERWPDWAPDRPAFVFAFRGGEPRSGLAIHDTDAGTSTLVARGGPLDFFLRPGWSPDGTLLVAQRRARGGGGSELWIAGPQQEPRALAADPAWFDWKPYFTRDGREVVFSRRPAAGGPGRIAAVAASGGPARELALPGDADLHSARPSPTRDEIAYVAERDGAAEVLLAELSGGEPRALTRPAERQAFAPRWSPDGERLALLSTPPGSALPRLADAETLAGAHVVVIDREGRVLFETPGMMPDWMPPWR
jgi:Tol biopolymer transport system component